MIPVLHFYHQKGCGFCLKGDEFLKDFERKHGGRTVLIVRHRIDIMDYPIGDWTPQMTPGYALVSNGTLLATHEGILDGKGLERFVQQKQKKRKKAKVGAKQPVGATEEAESEEELEDETEDE